MSVTTATYNDAVSNVLRQRYGVYRHAAKLLARAVGVSDRTVENWLAGSCAPRGAELIRLMAECDDLAVEINRLVAEAKCQAR